MEESGDGQGVVRAVNASENSARVCISSDGELLGLIVGIHRDPERNVAKWGVVASGAGDRHLFVPIHDAVARTDGLHVAFPAAQVRAAPAVLEPTRLTLAEESQLVTYYAEPATEGRRREVIGTGAEGSLVRSEESLSVSASEWRPFRRVRLRKTIRVDEVTHVVRVRREELVVEEEPLSAVERLEVSFGLVSAPASHDIDMLLHREEVVIDTRVVAYERIRAHVGAVSVPWPIEATLRKELVDIERRPAPHSGVEDSA